MTTIATVIPITRQSAPFTHEPVGTGVLLMGVEDRNGLEVSGQVLGIPRIQLSQSNTPIYSEFLPRPII